MSVRSCSKLFKNLKKATDGFFLPALRRQKEKKGEKEVDTAELIVKLVRGIKTTQRFSGRRNWRESSRKKKGEIEQLQTSMRLWRVPVCHESCQTAASSTSSLFSKRHKTDKEKNRKNRTHATREDERRYRVSSATRSTPSALPRANWRRMLAIKKVITAGMSSTTQQFSSHAVEC